MVFDGFMSLYIVDEVREATGEVFLDELTKDYQSRGDISIWTFEDFSNDFSIVDDEEFNNMKQEFVGGKRGLA